MAEHVWTILCAQWQENPQTHNVTLTEIIEEVQVRAPVPNAPVAFHANWYLATTWRRTDPAVGEEVEERIELFNPQGELLLGPLTNTWSLMHHARSRSVANVQVLAIRGSGIYVFRISHRRPGDQLWTTDRDYPVTIAIEGS